MTVIDKILREWSFRCHDGIVDINDPIKLSILNEILGFNLDEVRQPYESLTGAAKEEADKLIELFNLTKDNIQKQTSKRIIILSDIPRNEVFKKLQDLGFEIIRFSEGEVLTNISEIENQLIHIIQCRKETLCI